MTVHGVTSHTSHPNQPFRTGVAVNNLPICSTQGVHKINLKADDSLLIRCRELRSENSLGWIPRTFLGELSLYLYRGPIGFLF